MVDFSWMNWVGSMTRASQTRKARKAKVARIGEVEGLEDRALLTATFEILDATVVEGAGGATSNLNFSIRLIRDSVDNATAYSVRANTVDGVAPGGAVSPGDFTAVVAGVGTSQRFDFAAGTAGQASTVTQTFSVIVNNDQLDELQNETLTAKLAAVLAGDGNGPGNSTLLDDTAVGTIQDDDATSAPNVRLTTVAAAPSKTALLAELASPTTDITATLDRLCSEPVTVSLTYGGTATRDVDYQATVPVGLGSGTPDSLIIPAGSLTGVVRIQSLDEGVDEIGESIIVDIASVSNVSATNAVNTASEFVGSTFAGVALPANETLQQNVVTITDNDTVPGALPIVSIAPPGPFTIGEVGGTQVLTFTVANPNTNPITMLVRFGGTATRGLDYSAVGSAGTTLTNFDGTSASQFASFTIPGSTASATLTLTGLQDAIPESNETVSVQIGANFATPPVADIQAIANATLAGTGISTGSITDANGTGNPNVTLSFRGPTAAQALGQFTEAAAGSTTTVTATLSSVNNVDVTVGLSYNAAGLGGTAVAGDLAVTAGFTQTPALLDGPLTAFGPTGTFGAPPAAVGGAPTLGSIIIPAGFISGSVIFTSTNPAVDAADDELDETVVVEIVAPVTSATEATPQIITATLIDNDPSPATPAVSMTISAPNLTTISETAGQNVTTVTLTTNGTNAAATTVTVGLSYAGSTGILGTDFNVGGLPAGSTATSIVIPVPVALTPASVTFTITAVDDNNVEGAESVIINIVDVANGTELGAPGVQQSATVTITDNDVQTVLPTVNLELTGSPLAENAGVATVTARLNASTNIPVTVPLTFSGTATNGGTGSDFSASGQSIVILAGATTGTITLTGLNDSNDEPAETVIVTAGAAQGATNGATSSVTATITDDDAPSNPTVTLTTSGSTVAEATGTVTLTATLSTTHGVPVTVNLAYTGTATNGTDYATGPTSIVVPAGSLTGTAVLTATQDTKDEPNETIIATVSSVTPAGTATAQSVTVTITDDDDQAQPNVTLSAAPAALSEAAVGTTSTITATLSVASSVDVTVAIAFTGTATITSDFTASGSSIVIPAGATTGTITLTAVNDSADEADSETIIATISSLTGTTGTGTGQNTTVTLADDDATVVPNVTLSATPLTIDEAAGKSTVTATLSATTSVPVTVNLAYTGTATNVTDYTRSTASIVIAPGTTTGTAVITAVQDGSDEVDETVIVDIDTVPGGNEATAQTVTVTITDDDVNLAPVAADTTAKVNAGGTVTGTVAATDGNAGDTLVFTLVPQGAGAKGVATVSANGGFSYTANAGTSGTDTFTVSVTDGALTDTADVVVTINAIPVGAAQTVAVDAGETVIGVLAGTDTEPGALTFSPVGTVAGLIVGSGGAFSYTAAANGPDQVTFQYTVSDLAGATSAPATVTVNVDNNDPPVSTAGGGAVVAGTPFTGTLGATDPDGDTLTFIIVNQPNNGTLTQGANGAFTYTATSTTAVGDTFSFKASDGKEDSNTSNVVLTINQKPTANAQTVNTPFGTPATGTLTGADANGTTLTFAAAGTATGGTVVVNSNGTFTFTPTAGSVAAGSFTFTASDGVLTSTPATVTVNVNSKFSVATKDTNTVKAGKSVVVDSGASVTNVVNANFSAAKITISGSLSGDTLSAKKPKGFGSKDVTISGGKNGAALTITFNNGAGTQSAVDAVLKSIKLSTKGGRNASLSARNINFKVEAAGEPHDDTTVVSVTK